MRALLLALLLFYVPAWGAVDSAFQPGPPATATGTNTGVLVVTGTAQNVTCDVTQNPGSFINYYVVVVGTQTVFFNAGSTTSSPTAATTSSIPIPAPSIQVFTWAPNAVVSVIAGGTGSTFYCTAGTGL